MLRALPFILLFLVAHALAALCALLPRFLKHPVRSCELRLLYLIRRRGPGGFDDGVQMTLMRNADIYAPPVVRLLLSSSPNTLAERIALEFVEDVRGSTEVEASLAKFGNSHPNPETRRLVSDILAQAPRARHVS
jgi:hypothetical protein